VVEHHAVGGITRSPVEHARSGNRTISADHAVCVHAHVRHQPITGQGAVADKRGVINGCYAEIQYRGVSNPGDVRVLGPIPDSHKYSRVGVGARRLFPHTVYDDPNQRSLQRYGLGSADQPGERSLRACGNPMSSVTPMWHLRASLQTRRRAGRFANARTQLGAGTAVHGRVPASRGRADSRNRLSSTLRYAGSQRNNLRIPTKPTHSRDPRLAIARCRWHEVGASRKIT